LISGAAESPSTQPLRVLLADDQAISRLVTRKALERRGHTVVLADHGDKVVDAWQTEPFDVIVMDLQMPQAGGVSTAQRIRELEGGERHTPILGLSAHREPRSSAIADAGVDRFLTKPCPPSRLLEALDAMLTAGNGSAPQHRPAEADPVFDVDHALTCTAGNEALLRELCEVFRASLAEHIALSEAAESERDYARLASLVHALQGSLGSLGGRRALNSARELATLIERREYRRIQPSLAHFRSELHSFKRALDDYLEQG
jgi:CheY-like chemotaxis protein/HPt (histidine-containing phosphotransfer) domain-containing protein